MRVMCVNDQWKAAPGFEDRPRPAFGDEDVVIGEVTEVNGVYYQLERFGQKLWYHSWHFSVLPDEDADQIEAAEKEAIVPNPNAHVDPTILKFLQPFINN